MARFAREHWQVLLVIGIMAAAFLVRLHYLSRHTEYTADSYYFMILARAIRDTFTYTVRGVAHTKYLPGYPIAIWLGSYLFGGLERAANAIALLGGTFTVLATYGLGRELFNKWAGVVAALIVAFQPTFLKWTVLPMTEGLFTFLLAGGLYLVLTGCKRASPARRTLGAISGGLCFLVRWEGLLFVPIAVLIMLLYYKGSGLRWWEPFVMLAAFGLPMGIYVTRNIIVTGKVTSYVGEFREYSMKVTLPILRHRVKVYVWGGMSDALYVVLFFIGSVYCLVRKQWKPFMVAVGWFAVFAGFHLFWYYAYERFMAPAVPAVALVIAFLFVDSGALAWKFFARDGWVARKLGATEPPGGEVETPAGSTAPLPAAGPPDTMVDELEELPPAAPPASTGRRMDRHRRAGTGISGSAAIALRAGQVACVVVLAVLLGLVLWHGLARADKVITENYKAFADDHGGAGMEQAAAWLSEHAPGRLVAVDAGPYFSWLYYPGDEVYMRPVPWDLPVEQGDIAYDDVPSRLYERGVRYLVVGQTDKGLADELKLFGITGEQMARLKQVARWDHHYDYPEPKDLTTVVFEVLPPG